jgi:UDP-N-acetyl-D-glucosamine dehydrogenase
VGVSYKANVGDLRESPALKVIELLQGAGAEVSYHDPHVPQLPAFGLASGDIARIVAR